MTFQNPKENPHIEKINNGCIVIETFDLFRYTGDKKLLEKYSDIIKDVTDFLIDGAVEEKDDIAFIKEGEGADESIPRKNDTLHLVTILKSINALIETYRILELKIDPSYERIYKKLIKVLKINFKGKILLPFKDAEKLNTLTFTFFIIMFPDLMPYENIEKALKDCSGTLGLTNPGAYQNLIWPWAENQAAAALAFIKDQRSANHLSKGAEYASPLGAFPEKIRPDGYPVNYWYSTCHGSYVFALNTMIAHSRDDTIVICPALHPHWKDIEFKNISVEGGILVSAKIAKGKIQKLEIKNDSDQKIRKYIDIPGKYLSAGKKKSIPKIITLNPREKAVF